MPGHWELIALGIVILLLFGSKQLPAIARNLGRGVREVRETVVDVDPRTQLKQLEAPPERDASVEAPERPRATSVELTVDGERVLGPRTCGCSACA